MVKNENCWLKDNCNRIDCNKPNCIKLIKLDYLFDQACVDLNMRKNVDLFLTTEQDRKAFSTLANIKENINEFIKNGSNLYIYSSNVGNGKSVWALKLLQAYIYSIWSNSKLECKALWIHVPQFLLALKDNISEKSDYIAHIKKNILDCDLVIFDEFGEKTSTQFETEHLLSYINTRLSLGKSCIYTSNIKPEELSLIVGERLASRVIGLSNVIEFKGKDMRKASMQLKNV